MISDKLYELGDMIGLEHKDIRYMISNKQKFKTNVYFISPKEIYPKGTMYGTICINDI